MRFLDARNDLPADWAILVRGIDQVEKIGSNSQRQFVIGQFRAGEFLRCERRHEPLELLGGGNAMFQLPMPIIPLGFGDTAPETAPGGAELLY